MTGSRNDLNAQAQKQIDAFNVEEIKEELARRFLGFDVVNLKVGLVKPGRYSVSFTAVDQ